MEATRASTQAGQQRLYDVVLFNNWLSAYTSQQAELTKIYEKRFRDEFRPAFDAWLATNPFSNPDAPPGPLFMPQYHNRLEDQAAKLEQDANQYFDVGRTATQNSDNYVLTTVFLAMVLFFVAIAQRFKWPPLQAIVLTLALVMLIFGISKLATFPIK